MSMIEKAADAVLYDLRGRKLLKYLFAEDWLQRAAYGYVDEPIEGDVQQEIAQSLVRAVLLAIREPSEAAVEAGHEQHDADDSLTEEADAFNRMVVRRIWRAMIDESLRETL